MARFFIRRPIVAIVIAILTVIVGAITIALLPIAQFPNIAPPEIWLQANYPGADAKTLEPLMTQLRNTRERLLAIGTEHLNAKQVKALADTEASLLARLI